MGIAERKEREFLRRENEILEAAMSLFGGKDWQAVTIDQIAQQAEVGKGTVYLHFAGKDEIYARLALDFYSDMLRRLQSAPPRQDVLAQLREWIGIAWKCHRRGREYHRLVTYCHRDDFRSGLNPETQAAFDGLEQSFYDSLGELLAKGVAQGAIAALPLERVVNLLRAAFDGGAALLWHPSLAGCDPDQFIDDYTDFLLAGLTHLESGDASAARARTGEFT